MKVKRMAQYGGDEDDDDVEVALVCPSQNMGRVYVDPKVQTSTKSGGGGKPSTEGKSDSFFSIQSLKQSLISQTYSFIAASVVLTVVLTGCGLSYMYCRECLLGILILSACLCPWIPYFNIPLWVSIGMLLVLGFHFTNKVFTLMWE